ncbi:MAG: response regulator transcription factor [Limnochordaceae bacterium]|nr:response regulator transcription factor [Limnochordaceae bacterium]
MRVLVVEDDPPLAEAVCRRLREEGLAVDWAADGDEANTMVELTRYDLIILDWLLPGRDGVTLLRQWRQHRVFTPVLILTARDQVDNRVEGLDAGADDYLVKPFAFPELLARVRALLRREAAYQRDPVLRVGNLELDTVHRVVKRAGNTIELTNKEYAILEYLMRHPGQVLTRTQIAEHVWDYDFTGSSNVVDVYIYNLRRKIGDEGEPRVIRTIRGAGYQLRGSSSAGDDGAAQAAPPENAPDTRGVQP